MDLDRLRTERALVWGACGVSLVLGVAFVAARGPHPWGWGGFDDYDVYARTLARGGGYQTLELLWGYPAFLAFFYRVAGDRPVFPLLVQVIANAAIPWMIYAEFRHWVEARVAALAALLTGVLSFNTLFASTESSDALCTVLLTAALALYSRMVRRGRVWDAVAAGTLFGAGLSLRPHFLLLPAALIAITWLTRRPRVRPALLVLVGATAAAVYGPWIIWTWRVSGRFIPATTHGGVQLWYGTLQTGSYFEARTYNPSSAFESAPFTYSPPTGLPLVAEAAVDPCAAPTRLESVTMVFWTDRDRVRRRVASDGAGSDRAYFTVPSQPADTAIYYYFDAVYAGPSGAERQLTPLAGSADPLVHFVTGDHLGDQDRHGEFLDVFDIARMAKHVTWGDPVPFADRLDADGDGRITRRDLDAAVGMLVSPAPLFGAAAPAAAALREIVQNDDQVTLILADGGSLTIPRSFSTRVTDLTAIGAAAADIVRARRSFASRRLTATDLEPGTTAVPCLELRVGMNKVFFRRDPERQDRYMALAADNIARDRGAFVRAYLRRAYRLYTIQGTSDASTTVQFRGAAVVYPIATAVSAIFFGAFVAGMIVAWRRGFDLTIPFVTIVYVPLTVCVFFSEMRYSLTVQPLEFLYVAVALTAARDAWRPRR